MSNKTVIIPSTGVTTPISSYDSTKINLGSNIRQYNLGVNPTDKFIGPSILAVARPMEQTTSISTNFSSVISKDSNVDYVFYSDGAAAAPTRRIGLYEYNRTTSAFTWKGFITLTFPTATNHTIRGFDVARNAYSTGTVSVSGTTVTGVGTTWQSSRLSVGSRIAFGTTDPLIASTWYEIASINSNTSITLTASAGTISAGTPYVIDDLHLVVVTTNATATNGGLFIVKGTNPDIFVPLGTPISAATTTDNVRAVYWLADASTQTNTIAAGVAIDAASSFTDQRVYIPDVTGAKIYVYNIRQGLTLAAGKDITSLVLVTGNQALTGTLAQNNNAVLATMASGPGAGVKCLYFVTTTRIYRAAVSGITSGSTTWQSDFMAENPPGGTATFAASATMTNLTYVSDLDKFVITTTNNRAYLTSYSSLVVMFDQIFLNDDKQLDQTSSDSRTYPKPSITALPFSSFYHLGELFLTRISATLSLNQIYTIPINTDKKYVSTTNQYFVTPSIDVSDSNKLYNVYVNRVSYMGDSPFQIPTEPIDIYYRTSGISDNSGIWVLLNQAGSLDGISATTIQFAVAFQTVGGYCIPSRVLSLFLVYEDDTTDSHYEPSVGESSIPLNQFAFRQKVLWGSSIPNMRIRLNNAVTGVPIIDDTVSASAFGTWEYSSDGGSVWNPWSAAADAIGNYIRYTATSLPASTKIRVLLTQ